VQHADLRADQVGEGLDGGDLVVVGEHDGVAFAPEPSNASDQRGIIEVEDLRLGFDGVVGARVQRRHGHQRRCRRLGRHRGAVPGVTQG
jgi:hypothetical protein